MTEMEMVVHEGISCVTPVQWKVIIEHMYQEESRGPLLLGQRWLVRVYL